MSSKILGLMGFDERIPDKRVCDALPYKRLFENGLILTKEGQLLKVWRVMYPDASVDPVRADHISDEVSSYFQKNSPNQMSEKIAFWFVCARVPMVIEQSANKTGLLYMSLADKEIEEHRQKVMLSSGKTMKNVCYCCCSVSVLFNEISGEITNDSLVSANDRFRIFEGLFKRLGSGIFNALSIGADDPFDDVFNFLKYVCSSGHFYSYKCPNPNSIIGDFSDILSDCYIEKGKPMKMGDEYVQILTINDFPNETKADILLALQCLPFEFKWVTRWIPFDNHTSQEIAKKKKTGFIRSQKSIRTLNYEMTSGMQSQNIDTQARVDTENIEDLLEELANTETIGYLTSTVMISDLSLENLQKKIMKLDAVIKNAKFSYVCESEFQNYPAWKSTLVGDTISNRKKLLVKASNFSHIVPFTDVYRGFERNENMGRLTGIYHPLMYGRLFTGELFNFNLNEPKSQLGHFLIVGSTGGGKSTLIALIASQFARYRNSRVVLFDKDMSFANICKRNDGDIYIPGSTESPLFFSPLARIHEKPQEAVDWIESVVAASGSEVKPETSSDLMEIAQNWGNSFPTVEEFAHRLEGLNSKSQALMPLKKVIDNPVLNSLFCGDKDGFTYKSFGKKTMIEMSELMHLDSQTGNVASIPALHFIFSRLDEMFDKDPSKPTLLILDEAWLFLQHPVFRKKITEWLNTLRKKNVFVGFAVLHITDIDNPELFKTSCPTQIFLANPELKNDPSMQKLYADFGLTPSEIKLIQDGSQPKDYFIKQRQGGSMVDFELDDFQLKRLSKDGF